MKLGNATLMRFLVLQCFLYNDDLKIKAETFFLCNLRAMAQTNLFEKQALC